MEEEKIPLSVFHPGQILLKEFMEPLNISQNKLAISMRIPVDRINKIIMGKRSITPDTALRLSLVFKNSPEFWMNLQTYYDLQVIKEEKEKRLNREVISLVD